MARKKKPSIIFIDEIDSLCSSRTSDGNESLKRIKTEFLIQMQGVDKDSSGVLILGATNLPWNIDSAIRRRFERRVYINLPEYNARIRMFEIHLGKTSTGLKRKDLEKLAKSTDGYSGSDIEVVVKNGNF